jgi:hypothetical protein
MAVVPDGLTAQFEPKLRRYQENGAGFPAPLDLRLEAFVD